MTYRTQQGVTLLELLIVIAIVGVLASIGMPSMSEFVQTNRLKAARSQLISDMNYARSEAVKRNVRVLVCAANQAKNDCAIEFAIARWRNVLIPGQILSF